MQNKKQKVQKSRNTGLKGLVMATYFVFIISPSLALAKGLVPCAGDGEDPCNFDMLVKLVQNIITKAILIAPMLAAVAFAVAGFYYITAAGDTGKIKQAHDIAISAVYGLVIVLIAWILVKTIITVLGGDTFMILSK